VDVTNTGAVAGKEIIQVYVHDRKSGLVRPPKELKGFAKVELQPGAKKTVSLHLDFRAFAYYHTGYHQWITEDGEFDILIGASSADIRCSQTVKLRSTLKLPSLLHRFSTMRQWLDDPRGVAALQPVFELLVANADKIFNPDAHGEAANADLLSLILDMPLLSVLGFEQGVLPVPAEEMVDGLLEQVHKLDREGAA
jgi:beta-glucosidase